MSMFIIDQGTRKVAIDASYVTTIEASVRSPGWSLIILRDGREYSCEGTVEALMAQVHTCRAEG